MPKLWNETIDEHRHSVREALLDATGDLVSSDGITAVSMSAVARRAGISRATLYKYFPDTAALLVAWHERQVDTHIGALVALEASEGSAWQRLDAVLSSYALGRRKAARHGEVEIDHLGGVIHRGSHVIRGEDRVAHLLAELIAEAAVDEDVRDDVPARELAFFSVHALRAAGSLQSRAAVERLVGLVKASLQSRHVGGSGSD